MALRNSFIFLLSALLFTQSNAASDKDEFIGRLGQAYGKDCAQDVASHLGR
jgi:hypothetical protein